MKERIKLLIVLEATTGGAYSHVLQLATHIDKSRFNVMVVLSPVRNPGCEADIAMLERAGVQCRLMPMQRKVSLLADMRALLALHRLIAQKKFDIIHTHSSKAGLIGRIAAIFHKQCSVIHTPHSYFFQGKNGLARFLSVFPEQLAGYLTNYQVTVSESEQALTLQKGIARQEQTMLIRNVVPAAQRCRATEVQQLRQHYNIPAGHRIIAGVGRLTAQKDWSAFIHIAKAVLLQRSDVHFVLAGSGEAHDLLSAQIRQYGLTQWVTLTGHMNHIACLYSATDILLHTSIWEGMPYALLEAMSFGIPVVATAVPGNTDLIFPGQNGYLFRPGQYQEAAQHILSLLRDEQLRIDTGAIGKAYVTTHHRTEDFITQHETLYSKCRTV